MFHTLDANHIIKTLDELQLKISASFPGAGLSKVSQELTEVARAADAKARIIGKSDWLLRGLVATGLAAAVALLLGSCYMMFIGKRTSDDLFGTVQGIDSAINILVLMGASLFFLVSLEDRRKRRNVLSALQEVRSFIHVIDMHQLAKGPILAVSATPLDDGGQLAPVPMMHYLDFCSEMLSLASKVAALYAQSYPDPVVTEAVSDLERTATGLSQKIWQKINIINDSVRTKASS